MHRRALLHLFFALMLLLGQAGAHLHSVSHLAQAASSQAPQDQNVPHTVCDKCIAYAQFGSAAAASPGLWSSEPVTVFAHPGRSAPAIAEVSFPYLARAPPFAAFV